MNNEETVTISKAEYARLTDAYFKLNCLENTGVDNWCGWDDAMELYYGSEEE